MIYLELFFTFLAIGAFSFGGGYGMISLMREKALLHGWLTEGDLLNMIAVAESTPGPIAINAATYIGYKNAGIIGALVATLGICIPSFVIIYTISLFFDAFLSLTLVAYAFRGIQVGVVYLILSAGLKMLGKMKKSILNVSIISVTLVCMIALSLFAVKFSTIFYILISGVIGVIVYLVFGIKEGKK